MLVRSACGIQRLLSSAAWDADAVLGDVPDWVLSYLSKAWTDDRQRLAAACVPDDVNSRPNPALAQAMISELLATWVPASLVV
jgi:hypothetical protein